MPRTRRRSTAARGQILSSPERPLNGVPAALVASGATNYRKTPIKSTSAPTGEAYSSKKNPPKPASQDWQGTAWGFYDTVGEYRYGCDWTGNLLSRVKLVVHKNGELQTTGPAVDLLDALYDGAEGQADMLRQIGRHWTVAGDCYLIGDNVEKEGEADWLVAASTTIQVTSDGMWKVGTETFKKSALVIRLWRPHPTDRTISDAPSRAVLPILAELDGLTKFVAAQIDSRLAGNGILLLPSEMSFGAATPEKPKVDSHPEDDGDDSTPDDPPVNPRRTAQEFVEAMIEVAQAAITDREDPASLIPTVLMAEGEQLQHVRHISISTDLQVTAKDLRAEAVRRLALGLDMPPEVLMGTADMNHWSSWQIEEAAIKAHLEPLLDEICSRLTEGYLRPALDGADAAEYTIEADTSALRLRPNRSKEAIELYKLGRLSPVALLRENGFDPEADLMSDEEFKQWLLINIAGGSASPEQVQAAMEALGVALKLASTGQAPDPASTDPEKDPNATREARPQPSTKDHPVQNAPDTKDPAPSGASVRPEVVFAAALMVDRALERAGNRMATKLNGKILDGQGSQVPAGRAYRHVTLDFASTTMEFLLKDAWSGTMARATELGLDYSPFVRALDVYTRDLLQYRKPHTAETMRVALALAGIR